MENIKEWTYLPMQELLTRTSCKKDWKRISAESSLNSPRRPSRSRDWTELMVLDWGMGRGKGRGNGEGRQCAMIMCKSE